MIARVGARGWAAVPAEQGATALGSRSRRPIPAHARALIGSGRRSWEDMRWRPVSRRSSDDETPARPRAQARRHLRRAARRALACLRRPLAAAAAQDHPRAVCRRPPATYGTRDAAVFVEQDKRFTWNELAEAVDALAAGLLALGLEEGRPHRHLVAEPLGMAGDAIRHRAHRPDPGQHQPGLPPDRARICAEQGRLPGAGHAPSASRPPTISA